MIEIVPNWHPMVVHFALALPMSATLLYAVARLAGERAFAAGAVTAAHWMLGLGIAALWLAIGTGMAAQLGVTMDAAAARAVSTHQYWGWGTAIVFSSALPLWTAGHPRRVAPAFLLLCAFGSGCAVVTGYLGGENVYRHGVGVERLPASEPGRPVP